MLNEVVTQTGAWAASTGAPNALVVLFLLTSPSTWSERAVAFVDERLGGSQ